MLELGFVSRRVVRLARLQANLNIETKQQVELRTYLVLEVAAPAHHWQTHFTPLVTYFIYLNQRSAVQYK